jgi:hypothetical protein
MSCSYARALSRAGRTLQFTRPLLRQTSVLPVDNQDTSPATAHCRSRGVPARVGPSTAQLGKVLPSREGGQPHVNGHPRGAVLRHPRRVVCVHPRGVVHAHPRGVVLTRPRRAVTEPLRGVGKGLSKVETTDGHDTGLSQKTELQMQVHNAVLAL